MVDGRLVAFFEQEIGQLGGLGVARLWNQVDFRLCQLGFPETDAIAGSRSSP